MARKPATGTRERILDTAGHLFYDHGIHAVGMQQIIDECCCGKNLLYREFASKDELVVAYLERCSQDWSVTVEQAIGPLDDDPARQLLAIVRAAAGNVAAPGYRGCPFHNVHAEYPDASHPAHQVVVAHRATLREQLRDLAERAGARDPGLLAERLLLIIDGMYANGAILGGPAAAVAGIAFAEDVVRAATRSSSVEEPALA